MYKLSKKNGSLDYPDILNNMEASLKSAFYMHFRYLYNNKTEFNISKEFSSAIFYFIREYCYAAMFRYNKVGEFNVPYGGISYNRKDFEKKIDYASSNEIKQHMAKTDFFNLDFEDFLVKINVNKNDFIFLDPPYDSEFSTYAKNIFTKIDQLRLANILKNIKAKFMLIIKNTDFIYNLYNKNNYHIEAFNKKYLVSFKNRNNRDAEHLLIMNY